MLGKENILANHRHQFTQNFKEYRVAFLLTKQLDPPKGMLNALLENRLPSGHYDGVKYNSPESR